MSYAKLLQGYIRQSGKTLDQIAAECGERGISIHPTYISKLRLGHRPPPSADITRALAEVVGGDAERLLAEAGAARISGEQKETLVNVVKNRVAIDYLLDRLGSGRRLYPVVQEKLRELLHEKDSPFGACAARIDWTDRSSLGEFLASPELDRGLQKQLLERLEAIANSPEVLFEKWKASALESGRDVGALLERDGGLEIYPVGQPVKIPIIGTVTAGPNGTAYEDYEGEEWSDEKDVKGGGYFYLRVKGDSMTGDGILPNDLALVRETPEVGYGDIAVVVVDGEEGTLKRVYRMDDSIMLQSSNPAYPPRVFHGSEMAKVRIVGKVKQTIRRY